MPRLAILLAAALLALGSTAFAAANPYREVDGLVVLEAESAHLPGGEWVVEDNFAGFTGQGFLRFTGANNFGNPPSPDILTWKILIEREGDYTIRIRSRKDHPQSDLDNDSWFRLNDGPWTKAFTGASVGQWSFDTRFEHGHGSFEDVPRRFLAAGEHTISISGRSFNHRIDRIVLHLDNAADPLNLDNPESPTGIPLQWNFAGRETHGWKSGAPASYSSPHFAETDLGLLIVGDQTTSSTINFGFWEGSPEGFALEEREYRGIFRLATTDDPTSAPAIRLRITDNQYRQTFMTVIESTGDASHVPSPLGRRVSLDFHGMAETAGLPILVSVDWLYVPGIGKASTMGVVLEEFRIEPK